MFNEQYPGYDVTEDGVVYKNGKEIQPFKSNGYLQVLLFDSNHKRKVCGVHTVVAMKYLGYFDGCVVHHIDHDTHNNNVSNLEIYTRSSHASLHGKENTHRCGTVPWNKGKKMSDESRERMSKSANDRKKCGYVPWNKGKKLSDEIRQKLSEGARKRVNNDFRGNQFVDKHGDRRINVNLAKVKHTSVLCVDTGVEYRTLKEAEQATGDSRRVIMRRAKTGSTKQTVRGHVWAFPRAVSH